ncbi:MAG: hypothetical protein LBF21_01045, partial [Puniceicoccales bacterium]|nr:hypothetical protein [Puniceicoccales bacterium]
GGTAPLTFRQKLSAVWQSIKQFFGASRTGAAVNASSAQTPSIAQSSLQGMAAAARTRHPELANMTRSEKVDLIKENLQETLKTLNGRLEKLGADDSRLTALQTAKAKVEKSIQKMNELPDRSELDRLEEGKSNLPKIIDTLNQARAINQEVSRLLTA